MIKIVKQTATNVEIKTNIKMDPNWKPAIIIKSNKPIPTEQVENYNLNGSETDVVFDPKLIQGIHETVKVNVKNDGKLEFIRITNAGNPTQNIVYQGTETWELSENGDVLKIIQTISPQKDKLNNELMEWIFDKNKYKKIK